MSTKKKDNTTGEMILEKKETQADIQARMETGKIEIMKVVEGIPGAEKLAELIERGKKKGKLSSSELLDVLEDMELGTDQRLEDCCDRSDHDFVWRNVDLGTLDLESGGML